MSRRSGPRHPRQPQLTHFLSLPLHHAAPQLSLSLAALHHDLVTTRGLVSTSAVRPVATLHLTLGVMSLPSPALLQRAISFLETGIDYARLLGPTPLTVSLRGLETMGSRRNTSVLYAIPRDRSERLKGFAEAVRAAFEAEGLVQRDGREMKLHATVVNTVYSRGRRGGGGAQRETFNAEDVVDRYTGVAFAEGVRLDRVAICRMGEVRREDGTSAGYLVCGEKVF